MPRPEEYFSQDYATGGEDVTSSRVSEENQSPVKAAVRLGEKAVMDMESDAITYETRRPYRRVIKATVNP